MRQTMTGPFRLNRNAVCVPVAIVTFLTLVMTCSCSNPQSSNATSEGHKGVGVVISIAADHSKIEINHQEIKDFMPAMQMEYPVVNKSPLDSLKVGDSVGFTGEVNGGIEQITEIHKL
jgi:Cu/Ag efflux protein CusF